MISKGDLHTSCMAVLNVIEPTMIKLIGDQCTLYCPVLMFWWGV